MDLFLSLSGLVAVFWLTSVLGAVMLYEKEYQVNRGGWYLLLGMVFTAVWLYLFGLVKAAPPQSLACLFALTLWLARRRGLVFARLPWDRLGLLFSATAVFVLGSFVFRQHIPDFGGELILLKSGARDTLWHLALVKFLVRGVPPESPVAAGEVLRGYNYLSDLFWAGIHHSTHLSIEVLSLVVAPLTLIGVFAGSVWQFFQTVIRNRLFAALGACLFLQPLFSLGEVAVPGWILWGTLVYLLVLGLRRRGQMGALVLGAIVLFALLPRTISTLHRNLNSENYIRYDKSFVSSLQQLPQIATGSWLIVDSTLYDTSIVPALSGLPVYWVDTGASDNADEQKEQVRKWTMTSGACPDQAIIIWYPNVKEAQKLSAFTGPVWVKVCPHY